MFIAGVKRRKYKEPKYKIGEMVYSYQNKSNEAPISIIRKTSKENYLDGFNHKYKLSLKTKDGFSKSSNWIDEASLYKRKK